MSSELNEFESSNGLHIVHPSSFKVGSWKSLDPEQERAFIGYYLPRLRMLMLARLNAREDVDAMVQQVLLDSLRALRKGQLRNAGKLTQFVLGIARIHLNQHNHLEKSAVTGAKPVGELPELSQAKAKAEETRQIGMAEKAIQSLDPIDLQILTLTLLDGAKSVNLARRLSLSPDTVRQRKLRAAKRIEESFSSQAEVDAEQSPADEKLRGCNGEPAQELGLAYLEGILRGEDLERFEDHTFECDLCHKEVSSLIAVRENLRQQTGPAVVAEKTSKSFWPMLAGAVVLVLLLAGAYFVWQRSTANGNNAGAQSPAQAYPLSTEEHAQSGVAALTQMADLSLPVYIAPTPQGENANLHFLRGMNAYSSGDCDKVDKELSLVLPPSPHSNSANFYDGACLLHLGKSDDAFAKLSLVIAAGDIPEHESALYELAQVELTRNHLPEAHNVLVQVIALGGEHEAHARAEDAKLLPLITPKN
jgi:DNA-directed RNA polymerase specialized sigma24 family protein